MAYSLNDILNSVLGAVQDILGGVATALSQNAELIASIIVLGGLSALVIKYGQEIFARLGGMINGLTTGLF